MRLLITTDTVGGVWSFTSDLTRHLLARGHAVHLVSFGRQPSPDQLALASELRESSPGLFGFTASDIPLEWMQGNERAQTDGEALLQDVLSNGSFDLILSNQFCFGHLNTRTPRVVVAHSDVLSWAKACNPQALEPTPWLLRYTSMVQTGLLDAAALITPTDWMGKALVANFFLPRRYLVIPNGVTTGPASTEPPSRKLQAITAGRLWDEGKGLDTLNGLNVPMPLLVAGDNGLIPGTDQPAWPSQLTNLGPLSRPELHQHFRESALYLCTSRYEPFGLAPLEAALCGCAILANDLPSLREVWGDAALYFNGHASLRLLLQQLAHDPALLAEAQARAAARARLFSADRMTSSYLHLFETVLQQRAPETHKPDTPHAA